MAEGRGRASLRSGALTLGTCKRLRVRRHFPATATIGFQAQTTTYSFSQRRPTEPLDSGAWTEPTELTPIGPSGAHPDGIYANSVPRTLIRLWGTPARS